MKTLEQVKAEQATEQRNEALAWLASKSTALDALEVQTLKALDEEKALLEAELVEIQASIATELAQLEVDRTKVIEKDKAMQELITEISKQAVITKEDLDRITTLAFQNVLEELFGA